MSISNIDHVCSFFSLSIWRPADGTWTPINSTEEIGIHLACRPLLLLMMRMMMRMIMTTISLELLIQQPIWPFRLLPWRWFHLNDPEKSIAAFPSGQTAQQIAMAAHIEIPLIAITTITTMIIIMMTTVTLMIIATWKISWRDFTSRVLSTPYDRYDQWIQHFSDWLHLKYSQSIGSGRTESVLMPW